MGSRDFTKNTKNILFDSYAKFIKDLRAELIGANPVGKVKQRSILTKQTGKDKPPPKWIEVELVGKGGAKPKVAIRRDNVYVFAFSNADGNWYKLTEAKTDVLPDALPLGFEGNYNKLVGGAANLANLKFGKFSTSSAAVILWNHGKKKPYDDAELKRALATICVVLSEAARMAPMYNAVNDGWETPAGGTITAGDIKYYITGWSDC
ncbi:60 kDa jasmonate-induced protein [Brachypodium distachyon]|uniref:60 kDa jasmonate-induced protein n=1 Tax=Brachypodium distachyon TaxID=15368 RepID=UPI00052FE234|nr:60 kDa jasmonate-induced protein [Brachypodium distachyon]|eukprot:XP_010238964.1 60 kDa jasmonate-induced protein [Brachypodium distachyon]